MYFHIIGAFAPMSQNTMSVKSPLPYFVLMLIYSVQILTRYRAKFAELAFTLLNVWI
jgi:hypothetical protein